MLDRNCPSIKRLSLLKTNTRHHTADTVPLGLKASALLRALTGEMTEQIYCCTVDGSEEVKRTIGFDFIPLEKFVKLVGLDKIDFAT